MVSESPRTTAVTASTTGCLHVTERLVVGVTFSLWVRFLTVYSVYFVVPDLNE